MQAGVVSSHEVLSIRTRVLVNSVERPHVSWSCEAGIEGGLPAQVAGGNRVVERTGQLVFAHSDTVQETPETPWGRTGGWPPRRGDRIEVWDDVETPAGPYSYKQFTGRVDDVWGENDLSVSIIDDWDDLARKVNVLPMMRSMPGVRTGEATAAPGYPSSLRPFAPAYRALEQAGQGLLPPRGGTPVFHAAFQGSVIPDVGGVLTVPTNRYPTGEEFEYVEDMTLAETWGESTGGGTANLGIVLRASKAAFTRHGTYPSVTLTSGAAAVVVQAHSNGTVRLFRNGTEVQSVQVDYGPDDMIGVALLWTPTNLHVYSVGSGVETTVSSPGTPVALPDARCRVRWCAAVRVTRGEGRSAWLNRMQAVLSTPFLHRRAGWGANADATRHLEGETAKQILSRYAEHQMVSIWRDEHGILNMWGADRLADQPVVRTYTTTRDVESLPWRESWESVRSGVVVSYLEAARARSDHWGVVLWQDSNSKQLQDGDMEAYFIEPSTEEDWIEPDLTLERARQITAFNSGVGSFWGGVYTREDITDGTWAFDYLSFTSRQIGPTKLFVEHTVSGAPADMRVSLRTPPADAVTSMWQQWRDIPLPIVRGRGRITWADASTTETVAGPAWAPVLDFDMGWWGIPANADAIRDWLAPQVTEPLVTLEQLTLRYDPGLQLGDMIRIDAGDTHGVAITGLVSRLSRGGDTGGHSMTVTIQVRGWERNRFTYAHLEEAWASRTYTDFEGAYDSYGAIEQGGA